MYTRLAPLLLLCTLAASPVVADESSCVCASFDFLWWRPSTDRTPSYNLYTVSETFTATETEVTKSRTSNFHDRYFRANADPGFRLGLSWKEICQTCWRGHLQWTSFAPSDGKREKASKRGNINDILLAFLTRTEPLGISDPDHTPFASLDIDFDTVNVGISYPFSFNQLVFVHPQISLQYMDVTLLLKDKQSGRILDVESGAFVSNWKGQNFDEFKFRGFGPFCGVRTKWLLQYGFALLSNLNIGVNYGRYKEIDNQSGTRFDSPDARNDAAFSAQLEDTFHTSYVSSSLALGLSWTQVFSGCCPIGIEASWEHFMLFDILQGANDLSFQGLTLSATVGF